LPPRSGSLLPSHPRPRKRACSATGVSGQALDAEIDPAAYAIAAAAARSGGQPPSLDVKRAAFDAAFKELGGRPERVLHVRDEVVRSPGGGIPVRTYRPGEGIMPLLLYMHGGGFEKGSLDSHDAPLRILANACHCVIVSVGYRLAPEHRYPAQLNDAFAVLRWAAANTERLEVDPARFAVAGDSVGGNLAALVAIRARDEGGPPLVYQALLYPVTDLSLSSESWKRYADGPWLSAAYEAKVLRGQYLAAGQDPRDPKVSPLHADLAGLPRAFVATAEFDGYRDEGQAYAAKLAAAGVAAEHKVYPGQIHDFFLMPGRVPAARQLNEELAARLRRAFGYPE
jgi:acetyl esterase/lipase